MSGKRLPEMSPVTAWVVVVGLIAAVWLMKPSTGSIRGDRQIATISHVQMIKTALEAFNVDNGRYPTAAEGLEVLLKAPPDLAASWRGPYLDRVSPDKWGVPYRYVYPVAGRRAAFNVVSAGRDHEFGTGDDIDIDTVN